MPAPSFWSIVGSSLLSIAWWVLGLLCVGTIVGVVVLAFREHDRRLECEREGRGRFVAVHGQPSVCVRRDALIEVE